MISQWQLLVASYVLFWFSRPVSSLPFFFHSPYDIHNTELKITLCSLLKLSVFKESRSKHPDPTFFALITRKHFTFLKYLRALRLICNIKLHVYLCILQKEKNLWKKTSKWNTKCCVRFAWIETVMLSSLRADIWFRALSAPELSWNVQFVGKGFVEL